jgi:hypothetical protein
VKQRGKKKWKKDESIKASKERKRTKTFYKKDGKKKMKKSTESKRRKKEKITEHRIEYVTTSTDIFPDEAPTAVPVAACPGRGELPGPVPRKYKENSMDYFWVRIWTAEREINLSKYKT